MKITCVVIDDELNNLQNMQILLQAHCPEVEVLACAQDAQDGVAVIKQHKPELVLLDIQMPHKSGFDLLKEFPEPWFEVIFITAYDNYGIQAIKFSALDYLLKPVNVNELKDAIVKAVKKITGKIKDHKLENFLSYVMRGQKEVPKLALPTFKEVRYVRLNDIVRCEASDNYTTFYLASGEHVLVSKTLKEFAEILHYHGFIRTHQSHLVNVDFVKSLLKEDGGVLLLQNLVKVPISRQNKEEVKAALKTIL
jgi:two-component system LytT family response regulator